MTSDGQWSPDEKLEAGVGSTCWTLRFYRSTNEEEEEEDGGWTEKQRDRFLMIINEHGLRADWF